MSHNRVPSFKTPEAQAIIEQIKSILLREAGAGGLSVDQLAPELEMAEMVARNYLRHMGRKELAHMRLTDRKWFPGDDS